MSRRFKLYIFLSLSFVLSFVDAPGIGTSWGQSPPTISDDLDAESLRTAIRLSLVYLQKLPPDRVVGEQPRRLTAGAIRNSLLVFEKLLDQWHCAECFARAVGERFEFLPSSADAQQAEVLFTGYYQPVIEGSLLPSQEFRYPLYGKPADLMTAELVTITTAMTIERVVGRIDGEQFMPYYTRREIDEAGSLRGRGLEIAWVKDPIELFFLHIQGSGIIELPDGQRLSVGYAGQNGWPYRSIGRLLIDSGKASREEMSMQWLRRYLTDNPRERGDIFAHNESYVFFRPTPQGPLGSLEAPLAEGRSIATDARLFPKGALAFIQTQIPIIDGDGRLAGWRPITRFVLNQDTGGAIRGPQRADIYFGTGDGAGSLAGYMNRPGKMFFVMLKNASASTANNERDRTRDK